MVRTVYYLFHLNYSYSVNCFIAKKEISVEVHCVMN